MTLAGRSAIVVLACAVAGCSTSVRETRLQKAIKAHDVAGVRTLLDSGAKLGNSLGEPKAAWELSLRNLSPSDPRTLEIARLVLDHSPAPAPVHAVISIPARNKGQTTYTSPVEIAAQQWSPEGVRLLLDHGLNINGQGAAGALVHAAGNGCEPCIRMLLEAGAFVNSGDRNNDTPLAMARRVRRKYMVAFLVGRGARGPKPAPSTATRATSEALLGKVFGPDGTPPPEAEDVWIEGADILKHPAGDAALRLAELVRAGKSEMSVPAPDAVHRGIDAGSVLVVAGAKAQLHLITFDPGAPASRGSTPRTGAMTLTLELQDGVWTPVAKGS